MRSRTPWFALLLACAACDGLTCGRGAGPPLASSAEPLPVPVALVRQRTVGTPHSILLEAVDPGGRWVVACQPRADDNEDGKIEVRLGTHGELNGDTEHPWLIFDEPRGERLDAYIGHGASGRYLVVIRDEKLVLIDAATRKRTELDADLRDDESPHDAHRAAVFDPLGEHVAYARVSGGRDRIIVRTLSTGQEREIDPGPGALWRFEVAAGGESVLARVVVEDRDGDGKLGWPVQNTSLAARRCRGLGNYTWSGQSGDDATDRVIDVHSGKTTEVANVIGPLGDDWIAADKPVRDKDVRRKLFRVSRAGATHELVPASCGGRVRYIDHSRALALFECEADAQTRSPFTFVRLELHGKRAQAPLAYRLNRSIEVRPEPGTERFVIVRGVEPGGSIILDFDQPGRVIRDGFGGLPLAVHGTRVLSEGENGHIVLDLVTGAERRVTLGLEPRARVEEQTGRYAWMPPRLVDIDEQRVVGTSDALVMAVSSDGRLLHFPAGLAKPERSALRPGPLHWSGEP